MTREEARKAAQVMQAYADGAEIEARVKPNIYAHKWRHVDAENDQLPSFDWVTCDYRIKQTPDFIDWSHVAPEYKWMVRVDSGEPWLFEKKPFLHAGRYWCRDQGTSARASCISSYKRGTVDWKDSLVSREEWEAEQ